MNESSSLSFNPTVPQQLDPKAVWLFFPVRFIMFFFLTFWTFWLLSIFIDESSSEVKIILIILSSSIVSAIFAFIWSKLLYRFYRYELTKEGFRKELGIISKKYVTIPYDRIQNVDIFRGLWSRILGLSDLNIQTAGNSRVGSEGILPVGSEGILPVGSEGILPGVSKETAEQLRNELIDRASKVKNQGL